MAQNYPAQDVNGAEVELLVDLLALGEASPTQLINQRVYCTSDPGLRICSNMCFGPQIFAAPLQEDYTSPSLKMCCASRLPLPNGTRSCTDAVGPPPTFPAFSVPCTSATFHLPVSVSLPEGLLRSGEVTLPHTGQKDWGIQTPRSSPQPLPGSFECIPAPLFLKRTTLSM